MSRYRARRKQRKLHQRLTVLSASLAAFALLSFLSPKKSEQPDARTFTEGLSVKLNRTSPPFAALEDTLSDLEPQESDLSPFTPMTILSAENTDLAKQARELAAENQRLEQELTQVAAAAEIQRQKETLKTLIEKRVDSETQAKLQYASTQPVISNARVLPIEEDSSESMLAGAGAVVADPGSMLISGGKVIPLDTHPQETAKKSAAFEHPTQTIRLADLKMDRAELLKSLFGPLVSASREDAKVKAAAAASGRVAGLAAPKSRVVVAPNSVNADAMKAGLSAGAHADSSEGQLRAKGDSTVAAVAPPLMAHLVVSGPLEMKGGLALTTSQDQIVVYREVDGEPEENGYVWIRDGRYEIYVGRTEGNLVAELQTPSGDVLGRGTYDLAQLRVEKHQARADGIHLFLRPVIKGMQGTVRSAYSHGTKTVVVEKATVAVEDINQTLVTSDEGKFLDKDLVAGSIVITKTRKQGYWGTLAFAASGSENTITMYPDKMLNAFVSLVGGDSRANSQSIVWGRVTRNGEPVAGAQVEWITGETELKPVYFNSLLIPDPSLKETTANGLYAYFPVEPGVHAVQASFNGQTMDPVLFPSEAGYVSSLDLEAERSRSAEVHVFDALRTDRPVSTKVTAVGTEAGIQVGPNGQGKIRFASGPGILTVEAEGTDTYATTRVVLPRDRRSMLMPMIPRLWIEKMRNSRRISAEPNSGVIVGFVQSREAFQVYPNVSAEARANVRIVYFDGRGAPLRSEFGVPGGGYVIFNLPEGFSTVSVASERMIGLQAVTALVDSGVINVVNHALRSN